jgi:hypothetical protein
LSRLLFINPTEDAVRRQMGREERSRVDGATWSGIDPPPETAVYWRFHFLSCTGGDLSSYKHITEETMCMVGIL